MLEMILKMSAITVMYVVLTYILYSRLRDRKITIGLRIGIGIIYGICAILSTHFGVIYSSMVLNVRDLAPMSAGLFFDPVAGIIAGIIGGVERYIAGTYFGVGYFTRVACSVSTCFAGFFAAFLRILVLKGKKPSVGYAFFMGCVIEVFHMYVVFLTHRDDMEMAFMVVKTCAIPMIIFSGIGLALSVLAIKKANGELRGMFKMPPVSEVPIAHRFQSWLFGVMFVVFTLNFLFNYNLQTNSATQNAKTDAEIAEMYIEEAYDMMLNRNVSPSHLIMPVGTNGVFLIYDESGEAVKGYTAYWTDEDGTEHVKSFNNEILEGIEGHEDGEYFRISIDFLDWMVRTKTLSDGKKLVIMLPYSSIYEQRNAQAYEVLLSDILIFAVVYVLISMLLQSIIVESLLKVNGSLNRITDGDLNEKVQVYNSSEFASLSEDINLTVDALKGYIEAAEKRIEQELLLARTIQESALPKSFDFTHKGFDLFATMDPAREVGGDFYDFFFVDADKLALVIADVSGKGIPAALFMMHSKTAIRSLAETGTPIAEVFERVNNELCDGNEASMFVTVWMGIFDLKTGAVECVNAGHEYPAVRHGSGSFELFKDKHGLPLGAMEGMKYRTYEMKFEPGDCLFVYTDGVPEAIDADENQYGTERMIDALSVTRGVSMEELLREARQDLELFVGETEQFDDITMLGLRYLGM